MATGTNIREPKPVPGASSRAGNGKQEIDEAWLYETGVVPQQVVPATFPAEESKSRPFAPIQSDDISKDENVAADGIGAGKELRDHVLEHDLLPNVNRKISAETAAGYGLDQEEAHLALLYAKASKESTQNALTATPKESKRLSDLALWHSLQLDLCQRLKAAKELPQVLENRHQSDLARQLTGAFERLHKLEGDLFAEHPTAKPPRVTRADAQRKAYQRSQKPKRQTPTIQRPANRKSPHLAA